MIETAIDVAVEVLTAGTATPVLVAKRAARTGVKAAESGGKALAKAVRKGATTRSRWRGGR